MRSNQQVFLEAGRRIAEKDGADTYSTCLSVAHVSQGSYNYWPQNKHAILYADYFGTALPGTGHGVRSMDDENDNAQRVLAMCMMAAITAPKRRRK